MSKSISAPQSGNLVRVKITIRGDRPLLQHHFTPEALSGERKEKNGPAGNDPTEWQRTCLVTEDGQLYVPGDYLFSCIVDGARHVKSGRGSIQPKVAATLQVEDTVILLNRYMPKKGEPKLNAYADPVYIDQRGVRNPTTKGRNIRYRLSCSPGWECSFTIVFDKTVVDRNNMKTALHEAGTLCGLADGRSRGNGRFTIVEWAEANGKE